MKTKRFEGTNLRMVLIGMITDRHVLSRIVGQWFGEGLFDAKWANLVGGWCVEYFRKYQQPPGKRITRIFELWSQKGIAEDKIISAVEDFLQSLSDDHTDELPDHILDIAAAYFNKVRTEKELEAVRVEIDNEQVDAAMLRMRQIQTVNLTESDFVDYGTDTEFWHEMGNQETARPLVRYRGDLGRFTEGAFCRQEFYAFVAPDKTGKSTYLRDFIYQAARQRNRIAFFDMGDSNIKEVGLKLGIRSSGCPKNDRLVKIPIEWDDKNELQVREEQKTAFDSFSAFVEFRKILKDPHAFRISCHKNSTCSIQDIDDILEDWARDGFKPDVIGIDYADILARPKGISAADNMAAISENWKGMRRLSQQRDCLVMTATQTKATGYKKTSGLLGPEDFSGNKEKNAHVNGMLGINVSPKEKENGAGRVNWCVRREGDSNVAWYCRVAGHFAIGNPAIISKIC